MSWLKRILIGLAVALALLLAIVFAIGYWTPDQGSITQTMSITVGNRTVTVSGHYKSMTQESLADGVKVIVDGHKILLSGDQLTVDGKTQVLEPDQNVAILVDENGQISVTLVRSDGGGPADAAQ
jgi:hypothetical protein